jgi:hypothetical protein
MLAYFAKRRLKQHDRDNNRRLKAMVHSALLQQQALHSQEAGVGNNREHDIVVSLTSYDKRIFEVHLCIESLLQQSLRPDRIVLWLSTNNFPDQQLPELLRRQQRRGLDIVFQKGDLGPYKKFVYALERFPHSLLITVDDDILYPPDMVEQLYVAYLRDPATIHCHRGHRMQVRGDGHPRPYHTWSGGDARSAPSLLNFPTGMGGVLYFPGALHPEALNQEQFMRLCPNADDIWLKAMSLKNGVACAKIRDPRHWKDRFLTIEGSQDSSLKRENWDRRAGNDKKLEAVFSEYHLSETLRSLT